jgi:CheY-like chemotaxis protein
MVERVLIVDDSRVARMIVRRFVAAIMPELKIVEAGDASEALQVSEEYTFDYALLDFNMPGDDGLTLASSLMQHQPDLRVALLTANVQAPVRERAAEIGVDFIGKPPTEDKIRSFLVTPS